MTTVGLESLRGSWLAAVAMSVGMPGCATPNGFGCTEHDQCRHGAREGMCEPVGFCSYPDGACPSGWRFSAYARQPWTEQCTDPPAASSSSSSETGSGSTSEPGSTTEADTGSVPQCGNGIVEEGESCDDGNEVDADGCNADCRLSGLLVQSFTSDLPGLDRATDLVVLEGGDVVVTGFETVPDELHDVIVIRYDPSGRALWSYRNTGDAHRNDEARAVALAGDGLLIGGWVTPEARDVFPRPQLWLSELAPEDGQLRWEHIDGGGPGHNDQAWDVLQAPDGSIMMAGRMGPAADRDLVLRRYDRVERRGQPALTLAWANNLAGAAGVLDVGNAVLIDAQGAVLVGGALQQSTEEMDRHLEAFDLKSGARLDPPCVDDGNPSEVFIADERINDLALAPDGHIAAVGFQTKTEGQGKDAWVGYYLPSGCELAWNRTVSGDNRGDDEAVGVAVDDAGDLVTVGFLFGSDSEDLWVAKWDASGDVRWQAMLVNGPGNGDDQARAVSIGADGEINVAGFLSRAGEAGLSDIWVGRFTP